MSYEQPEPHLRLARIGHSYLSIFKEHPYMDDECNTKLPRQDGSIGQRLRGINVDADRLSDNAPMTLAHADCNDGNQSGMGLRHSPRYERPHKHDLTHKIC